MTWNGASPAGILRFFDSDDKDLNSKSVSEFSEDMEEKWLDSKILKLSCKLELLRIQKMRNKKLLPVVREYKRLLRYCMNNNKN